MTLPPTTADRIELDNGDYPALVRAAVGLSNDRGGDGFVPEPG